MRIILYAMTRVDSQIDIPTGIIRSNKDLCTGVVQYHSETFSSVTRNNREARKILDYGRSRLSPITNAPGEGVGRTRDH